MKPKCKFCDKEVEIAPGMMMVETVDEPGSGFICHEECYQQSGEDEGYVERLHETLDEEGYG